MAANSSLSKNGILTALVLMLTFTAFSQQKTNYSLLWRISGKGLTHPSYLFGTMHVRDIRVFSFSDSVMLSLQKCSRFALEVHPDTIFKRLFTLMQSNDTLNSIDKLLTQEEYNKLAQKFQKKKGYPMGKITPLQLESDMEDNEKPDDKQTFIDAYLYGIARTLNKPVFGLEDADKQVDEIYGSKDVIREKLLEFLDDEVQTSNDESEEEMINIYSTGDLDAIYKYAQDNDMIDSSIIARNKVMASSMIKYMAAGPLFTAVGAAHLPGSDGVIALLRNAGYTVTKVPANFTGVASGYKVDYMKMDWPENHSENLGYSISFPGPPVSLSSKRLVYVDISNSVYLGFFVTVEGSADEPADWNKVLQNAISTMKENNKGVIITSRKDFSYNGLPCTEIIVKLHDGYLRTRYLFANNNLYTVLASSVRNHLSEPYVNRYFNSFKSFLIPHKAPAAWVTYTNLQGAFSVKMPNEPQPIVKEVPFKIKKEHIFKLNLFLSLDTARDESYLVRYNDYPDGVYLSDRKSLFDKLLAEFQNEKFRIIGDPKPIWQNGVEGREVKLLIAGGVNGMMRLFIRGDRIYLLLSNFKQDASKNSNLDTFFNSFTLLPYKETQYYNYQVDSANFKVQLFAAPQLKPDSEINYNSFLNQTVVAISTNPNSGAVCEFEYSKINPYYRSESIDSTYEHLMSNLSDYNDTVIRKQTVMVNGVKASEELLKNKEKESYRRICLLINGNYVYFMSCFTDSAGLYDKEPEHFFSSYMPLANAGKYDFSTSKAQKICDGLASADSNTRKVALGALSFYEFKKNELPYLYKALQRNYPDDTASGSSAKYKLIQQLIIVNDDSTVSVLANLYGANQTDEVKGDILTAIPVIDKKTSYDIYLRLLTTDPPVKIKSTYGVFSAMDDSVEFAATHFTQLLPFLKINNFRKQILSIARDIAGLNKPDYNKMLMVYYPQLTAHAVEDMNNYLRLKDSVENDWSGNMYNYLQLANKVKDNEFNNRFTAQYLEKDPKGLYSPDAVNTRVYNNLPVNQTLVIKFLDSLGTRYELLEAYNTMDQLNLIPLQYRTVAAFAKINLYKYISTADDDDDNVAEKMALLGTVLNKGSVYYVFKFKIVGRDDDKTFIGIVGPYKAGSSKLIFDKYYAYTNYDELKPNWRQQAESLIKPLIDAYK